jgi:hypothetical protein
MSTDWFSRSSDAICTICKSSDDFIHNISRHLSEQESPRFSPQVNITMPPRLPALAAFGRAVPTTSSPLIISYFLPLLQSRSASILATLSDNPGAYNKRIRRGRGPSSGKGKTSGRGHKGQKQHGKVPARFQGGQTPQEIVHGTRGFENQYAFSLF